MSIGAVYKAFALSVVLTLALASAAFADQVSSRIDTTIDDTPETITLNEGDTQNVLFRAVPITGDADNNGSPCNIDAAESLTAAISSSDATKASASPDRITWTGTALNAGCNQDASVTVTAGERGTATLSAATALEAGSNTTGSTDYDYTTSDFTVTVNNVAPTVSDITDQSIYEGTSTAALGFTVGDAGTQPGDLTVTGSSSNTTLVPNANIAFGGSGANQTVTVTPESGQSGTTTITVSVSDGAATTSDTFVLTVNPNNPLTIASVTSDGPVDEGSAASIAIAASDSESDSLLYEFDCDDDSSYEIGPQTGNTAQCNFNEDGTRRVNVRVTDGKGGTATDFTNVTVNNVVPDAGKDSATTDEDTPVNIDVKANDTDLSGDTFSVSDVSDPSQGTATINPDNTVRYVPDANYTGTDSFTYTVTDDDGGTATATVTVTVNPVNDAPTADAQSVTANEDDAKTITLAGSDADGDGLTTFEITSAPTKGTLGATGAVTCTGTAPKNCSADVTYTPEGDYNGSDSFEFRVNDGTVNSAEAALSITVDPANDAPTISTASANSLADLTIQKDTSTGPILFTVGDLETSAGSLAVSGSSSNTALVPNAKITFGGSGENRAVTITPVLGKTGTATITVSISDGTAIATDTFVLTVTDTIAPAVKSVKPFNGQTGLALTTNVYAFFSEAMNATTINKTTFTLVKKGSTKKITATMKYYPAKKMAILDPKANLVRRATYIATVTTGARDTSGNALTAKKVWQFKVK